MEQWTDIFGASIKRVKNIKNVCRNVERYDFAGKIRAIHWTGLSSSLRSNVVQRGNFKWQIKMEACQYDDVRL